MRLRTLLFIGIMSTCALAQQPDPASIPPMPTGAPGPNPLVTLASEFFEHNYVNVYAFGDGVLDTNNPIVTDTGQVRNSLGTGFDVGGGINLSHAFSDAQLVLSYSGAYRDYQSAYYSSGTTQNLSLGYTKRIGRRLTVNAGVGAGIFLYGGTFFEGQTTAIESPVITNPFSPETKYFNASLGLTYQQSRRLSYTLYGNFFLSRYNFPGSIGTSAIAGGVTVNYRVTSRTTLSGSYSHSDFYYQQNAGQGKADQIGVSLYHVFSHHWTATVFAGGARTHASGVLVVPITLQVGNQAIGGYYLGAYNETALVPSFNGSVSHALRHSLFSASAGEGIAGSGNGYFLASRNIYANGVFSHSWGGQNISLGGAVYRLSSIANTISASYSSATFTASYGKTLVHHVGMFVRYSYTYYGTLAPYNGVSDNRISAGLTFSSQNVPLTLF